MCEGTLNPAHEDPILEALVAIGIRAVKARGCADQDFHHAALYTRNRETSWANPRPGEAAADLRRTDAMLKRHPPQGPQLIRAAVNASALLGYSAEYFREGAALAPQHGATLQVHVGRDREEVEFCLAVWGRRPIERPADLGVVDRHLVAVHAEHAVLASESEIEHLAEGGATLAHSPIECVANMNGVPNLPRFRRAGIRVALGGDNQANDMVVNMRACWLLHAAKWGLPVYDPEFLSAREVLAMATIEAAQVVHLDDRVARWNPARPPIWSPWTAAARICSPATICRPRSCATPPVAKSAKPSSPAAPFSIAAAFQRSTSSACGMKQGAAPRRCATS